MVLFDQQTYDRMVADVPKMKLITTSTIVERFKVNGSLARKALQELVNNKVIKVVSYSSKQGIYTRATRDD